MPIYYPDILSETSGRRSFSYTSKDAILYALGIGMGEDQDALSYVYEVAQQVVPTAVTVLGGPIMPELHAPDGLRKSTLNPTMVVHGSQKVTLHRALKPDDQLFAETRVLSVLDKGIDRGAVLTSETLWAQLDGSPVATLVNTFMARGDGGFGGPRDGPADEAYEPDREPDRILQIATRPDQALLYRLNGDSNPLHADQDFAVQAGFPRPILHGLCTFGITCRAILQEFADYDASRIHSHELRFSAPVYPGETLQIAMWCERSDVFFNATVIDRDLEVVRSGRTVLNPQATDPGAPSVAMVDTSVSHER